VAAESISEQDHHLWWKEAGGWQLRQILYWRWDPIGVSESFPAARDEYDGYAGAVCNLLSDGAEADAIADHLAAQQAERMDLPPDDAAKAEIQRTSELLVRWYSASIGGWQENRGTTAPL
jgi:hypothetical protein